MESNDALVDSLVDRRYIETDKVQRAFKNVDRLDFTPESYSFKRLIEVFWCHKFFLK